MSEVIPEGWAQTTIGAVTQEVNMRVGDREEVRVLSSTKHYGLVPSDEYFKNRIIYSSDTSNYKLVRRGVFAYATNHLAEGSIGYQDRFDEACVSPIYTVFSCDARVHGPYFFRLLKSARVLAQYKLHEQASVDRRGAIRYSDFSKIPILFPPLVEQGLISEALDAVDEAIFASAEGVDKLSLARTGLISAALSEAAVLAGERASLGSRLLGVQAGYSPNVPNRPASGDQWGVLKVSSVQGNGFVESENKVIENPGDVIPGLEVRHGDLLMTRANTSNLVGLSCLVHSPRPGLMLSDKILRLNVREDLADKGYVDLLIKSSAGRRQIEALGTGSSAGMKNVSRGEVRSLTFPWPELKEQQRVVSIVRAHDERIVAEQERLEKLRKLKVALMDDLLTGRVRVDQLDELPV